MDSSVGKAMGLRLDNQGSVSDRDKIFSLFRSVQTGSEAHSSSYLMVTGGKAAGT
jgi:hypothetical protein